MIIYKQLLGTEMKEMKLDYKRTALVGLAFMTISAFWQLYNNEVPLMLENLIGNNQFVINIIMSLDNVLALFLLPFFGALSDRTHTRLGKRMPYIVAGISAAVVFMLLMPFSYLKGSFAGFFIAVGGLLLAMSFYRSPAVALMPDVTPKPLRSKGNAVVNLMGAVGMIFIQAITILVGGESNYTILFLVAAAFMLVSMAVMLVTVNENKLVAEMPHEEETEEEKLIRTNKGVKLRGSVLKSLLLLLTAVFLWYMAYSAIETNYTRYAQSIWGLSDGQYSKPMLVSSIVALGSFVPLGMLSMKMGRKKTILVSLALLLLTAVGIFFIRHDTVWLYILCSLLGVSWAAINVNSYPMVVEMSRGADVGKYTGLYYTFSMAAQIATPLITGFLFDVFSDSAGFLLLFPYAAFFLLAAFVVVIFVRHGDSVSSQKGAAEAKIAKAAEA